MRMRKYRWEKYDDTFTFKHHMFYVIGAPRRRGRTLTCQPHP